MKKITLSLIMIGAIAITGCATSTKVQVAQVGDNGLTCRQIGEEMAKLDKATSDVESKKGATGTNVAAAVAFLPGLVYTYMDAGEAESKINERQARMAQIADMKHCDSKEIGQIRMGLNATAPDHTKEIVADAGDQASKVEAKPVTANDKHAHHKRYSTHPIHQASAK